MAKPKPQEGLVDHLDTFFLRLMQEAYPGENDAEVAEDDAPKVGFVDRVRLFDSGVRWISIKNRVSPDEEEDAFAAARKRTIGSPRRRRTAGPPASGSNGSA
jgi:hypothetical protein